MLRLWSNESAQGRLGVIFDLRAVSVFGRVRRVSSWECFGSGDHLCDRLSVCLFLVVGGVVFGRSVWGSSDKRAPVG